MLAVASLSRPVCLPALISLNGKDVSGQLGRRVLLSTYSQWGSQLITLASGVRRAWCFQRNSHLIQERNEPTWTARSGFGDLPLLGGGMQDTLWLCCSPSPMVPSSSPSYNLSEFSFGYLLHQLQDLQLNLAGESESVTSHLSWKSPHESISITCFLSLFSVNSFIFIYNQQCVVIFYWIPD